MITFQAIADARTRGRIGHVEVEIGEAVIMLLDAQPDWPATSAHLRIYVIIHRSTRE
jgi:uncharacterized glyoxalase superfamily protein PhnB